MSLIKRDLSVALLGVFFLPGVHAVAAFLNVTPSTIEVSARPGSVVRGKFIVTNTDEFAAPLQVDLEMGTSNSSGETVPSPPSDWLKVKVSSRFVLHPREPRKVRYQINVPKDFVGEKVAYVFFSLNSSEDGAGVGTIMRVGVPIYLTARGTEIGVLQARDCSVTLGPDRDLQFKVELELSGNAHDRPRGEWVISEKDGQEIERVSLAKEALFPGKKKAYSAKSERAWLPGTYSVRLVLTHGEKWGNQNQPLTSTRNFEMVIADGAAQLRELDLVP